MKHHFTFVSDPSLEGCAQCRISLRSWPFLADHGFQDMVVLPGSFYIDMALSVHRERFNSTPPVLRNIIFQNPVILSPEEETTIRIEVRSKDVSTIEYSFYEVAGKNGGAQQYAARLEVDCRPSSLQQSADELFSIEAFQARAHEVLEGERFYQQLRSNGNQYGLSFRCVDSIWRACNESLGKLSSRLPRSTPDCLHAALLDAMTHVLAAFMKTQDRTFILQSIERIEIADLSFPDTLWCHARLRPDPEEASKGVVGDVRVFDSSGNRHLTLSGVAFSLLERPEVSEESPALPLVVASNFTAEPIEDCLKFWAAHFNLQAQVQFAPYDQIFQQLLQTKSVFHRNSAGVNIILLQLEKWVSGERKAIPRVDKKRLDRCFGGRKRCTLPNGLDIVHLNGYETEYLFKEIFEEESYVKHGIGLRDGATVVDIGANVGLFSLFVMSRCRNPGIYAFEPGPAAYDALRANCEAYGSGAQAFNLGVSNRQGSATFTFYENSSVFSGFHPDETADRGAIQAVVRNMLHNKSVAGDSVQEYVDELTTDRLRRTTHECRLTTVSEIIRENHIEKIDLLKIDAEKSEVEIIRGIADGDWPKIDQMVIEIHDPTGETVRRINDLLVGKGFRCAVEHEKLLEHSGLVNLYAIRHEAEHRAGTTVPGQMLQPNAREFFTALQSFTSQNSAPLILCFCPASPAVEDNAELKAAVADAERELISQAETLTGVSTIGSEALLQTYPVVDYYDIHSHQLGDIPYTSECYAAMGTALFRTIFNLKRKPFKVIVLDCDNTLWQGVCGEDGPRGVVITESYRALQQFMIDQMNAGMLLCLCSKNREQDVMDVFDQRPEMPLKREHFVSWRINWKSKSENVHSLAKELNLGLDSFILVDDNPVDCADVEINCPDVLTLRLPADPTSFGLFLNHIWAFDHGRTTEEDRNRARMYHDEVQREHFRAQAPSLNDFIAGLNVHVEIGEATDNQLDRISQLTFRTNQFNFTAIRRSPGEIRDFLNREGAGCLAVKVNDRFGDYGLTGAVLYEMKSDCIKLDTFLLSCRVLGRGVEHQILSSIGQRASSAGRKCVELTCLPTERNLPAREFVSSLGDQFRSDAGELWIFPADYLASIQYNPDAKTSGSAALEGSPEAEKSPHRPASGFGIHARSEQLQTIAEELSDLSKLTKAIDEFRVRAGDSNGELGPQPSVGLETTVLNIWKKILGRPSIGMDVNFFEAGGTSLKAVQIAAMIRKELKQSLSVTSLFECPTVRLLAARLNAMAGNAAVGSSAARALARGQQRRTLAMRGARSR